PTVDALRHADSLSGVCDRLCMTSELLARRPPRTCEPLRPRRIVPLGEGGGDSLEVGGGDDNARRDRWARISFSLERPRRDADEDEGPGRAERIVAPTT